MDLRRNGNNGLKHLIEKYRNEFRKAENIDYYSSKNYREAEKKYLRFRLTDDPLCNGQDAGPSG